MSDFGTETKPKAPSKIALFLLKLQEDSKYLGTFNKDPDKVLNEAGIIDDEARNAFKNGDIIGIRKLLFQLESGTEH
jgi:hypothetical protein